MSSAQTQSDPAPRDGRSGAGRGVIFIALAKLYFMVAGAVIEFRLPALLGHVSFGAYGVVSSLVSPVNNVMIVGTIQSISKFTAHERSHAAVVQRAGVLMHLWVGLPVAAGFAALAPLLSDFFHDQGKSGPLVLSSGIIAGYSFYAVFVGRANGTRAFARQAGLDVSFATLRAAGILGLASAGFGLYGAIAGWVLAIAAIILVASFVVGLPQRGHTPQPLRPLLRFFGGIALYLALMNFIMVIDQLLLKRLVTEWYRDNALSTQHFVEDVLPIWMAEAVGVLQPSDAADAQVGYYRAVQNLARLSYQAILAATFVVFPLVSKSTFRSDREATQNYVHTTMRYSTIVATGIAVIFVANPYPLLKIPYASDYAFAGAPALALLALGNVAFSIIVISGTILNGAGHTRTALLSVALTLLVATVANGLSIPHFVPGRSVLLACSASTTGAMGFGAGLSSWLLWRKTGAGLEWKTICRVVGAAGVAVSLGRLWTTSGFVATFVEAAVVGLCFLAVLVLSRELGRDEWRLLVTVLKKKRR